VVTPPGIYRFIPPITTPISLSSYYRGGIYVANSLVNANIPTAGTISIGQFYGATRSQIYNYTLNAGQFDTNFSLLDRATLSGFVNDPALPPLTANITINGVLGSTNVNAFAFRTRTNGTFARAPIINITVGSTGVITGAGGNINTSIDYGWGPVQVLWGGYSMLLLDAVNLYNYGVIQGGGGSGSPGAGSIHGSGAGYTAAAGIGGSPYTGEPTGILFSGGALQNDDGKNGGANGGQGGGWVAASAYSSSTNGYGGGAGIGPELNSVNAPGASINNTNYINPGSVTGLLRGPINYYHPAPPFPNDVPVNPGTGY
jgi:hypothetical protein